MLIRSQFHVTAAGKEGAKSGELEASLSRAARALWEHIHDQVPSSDGKRDKLTLDQFLDTWASLIDHIMKHGSLPSLVQDLVNLGFELYSKKDSDDKPAYIPLSSFEQLFSKMNLGRSYALIANKFLTEVCFSYFLCSILFILTLRIFRMALKYWMLIESIRLYEP